MIHYIVCGAPNVAVNLKVPVAPGTFIHIGDDSLKLKEVKIRSSFRWYDLWS